MATLTKDLQRFVPAFIGFVLACCCTLGNPIRLDVPDGVVYTDLHKTVELGSGVVLKCQFHGTPLAVHWKKGDNPSTSPNLISWVEGEPDSGLCMRDRTCEMGDDFSLIIKNVNITDQGRYICRISNYLGILLHNTTDVRVYASPEEPYPVIKECEEHHGQNCTFPNLDPRNITCTSSRFFPHIDLFFLHGSEKYTTLETWELTNSDGTKNKSIFTIAQPSKKPYVCVAFNIPGFQDQRTATVAFRGHSATNDTDSPDENDGSSQMPIVVPLVSCGALLLVFVAGYRIRFIKRGKNHKRKRGHDGSDEETTRLLQGSVSSYELWYLASYKKTEDHKEKLRKMFRQLGISDFEEQQLTPLAAYQSLCTWRDGKAEGEQLSALKKALEDVRYNEAWHDMCDHRKDVSIQISPEKFKEILQHVRNFHDVTKFVEKVTEKKNEIEFGEEEAYAREVGLHKLTEWYHNRKYEVNPFVSLSFALESVGSKPMKMMTIWIPGKQTTIQDHEFREFTIKLTERHCQRLLIYLKLDISQSKGIILGNNHYLLDTKSMIADRLRELECSNYEKRCRLDDAIIRIGRYDLQDHFGTIKDRHEAGFTMEQRHPDGDQFDTESIFDDDIPNLAKMIRGIPPVKKTQFQDKIGFNSDDNAEDDILEERIKKWRDSVIAKGSKDQSLNNFRSLRKELSNTKFSECIGSKSNTKHVTREELPRIALDLLMKDVRPIIKALDIDQNVVSKYVKQWDGKGSCTIELVKELLKNRGLLPGPLRGLLRTSDRDREDFCQVLQNIGFVDVARSVYYGLYETES